jgi:hypothetical protein
MEYKFTMYKYLVPTLHRDRLAYLLIPTLFSEPREGFVNEREMSALRDLGKRVIEMGEDGRITVHINILLPYDPEKEALNSLEVGYDMGEWLKLDSADDKELFQQISGQLENVWGLVVDDVYKSQMHKLLWHYLKSLVIFHPLFFPYMYGASYKYIGKRVLKKTLLDHINEFIEGAKALAGDSPQVRLSINPQPSICLKKIRKLIESGIRRGKRSKKIKKEVNDYLLDLIGYGEYDADIVVPDIVYEFYRSEAVLETLGRERSPTYLWKIKNGDKNERGKT